MADTFSGFANILSKLVPGAASLGKDWQQSAIEAAGNFIGPVVDTLSSNKSIPEKALRTAAAVTEPILSIPATLLSYSPEAKAAIRPGGAADLNMFHASSVDKLLSLMGLTAPSIAVTSNRGNPFARASQANLVMNPNYRGFDPSTSKSQLINRDAYVDTGKNEQRPGLQGEDVRLTQDFSLPLQHMLSILFSPNFKSFKSFEDSELGAKVIRNYTDEKAYKHRAGAEDAISAFLTKMHHDGPNLVKQEFSPEGARKVADLMRAASRHRITEANTAIAKVATTPANYAELKMVDELPINADTVSAIFLPSRYNTAEYKDQFSRHFRDIPVGSPADLLPEKSWDLYKGLAEQLTEQSIRTKGDIIKSPYLPDYSMGSNRDVVYDNVMQEIISSEKFMSDVASMLTSGSKPANFTPRPAPEYDPAAAWKSLTADLKELK